MSTKTRHAAVVAAPSEGNVEGSGFVRPLGREVGELGETRGVVFVEYVALLTLVTIAGAAAVLSLGMPLVNLFSFQQLILSLPFP